MRIIGVVALVACAGIVGACQDQPEAVAPNMKPRALLAPEYPPARPQIPAEWPPKIGTNKELLEIGSEIDGFAGYWFESGEWRIGLTADIPERRERARDAVVARLTAKGLSPHAPVAFVNADYSFRELFSLYSKIGRIFAVPGVESVDIDERRNRLVFGMRPGRDRQLLMDHLRAHEVPQAAVLVENSEIELTQTVQDVFSSLVGGIQGQLARYNPYPQFPTYSTTQGQGSSIFANLPSELLNAPGRLRCIEEIGKR